MIVVAYTTPLILLMKTGKLGLLKELFGKVFISRAVYQELIGNLSFENEAQEIFQ